MAAGLKAARPGWGSKIAEPPHWNSSGGVWVRVPSSLYPANALLTNDKLDHEGLDRMSKGGGRPFVGQARRCVPGKTPFPEDRQRKQFGAAPHCLCVRRGPDRCREHLTSRRECVEEPTLSSAQNLTMAAELVTALGGKRTLGAAQVRNSPVRAYSKATAAIASRSSRR